MPRFKSRDKLLEEAFAKFVAWGKELICQKKLQRQLGFNKPFVFTRGIRSCSISILPRSMA